MTLYYIYNPQFAKLNGPSDIWCASCTGQNLQMPAVGKGNMSNLGLVRQAISLSSLECLAHISLAAHMWTLYGKKNYFTPSPIYLFHLTSIKKSSKLYTPKKFPR
jgi:hypothetical protein